MITAERLEELIKQGAKIYCLMNNNGLIADFDLSTGDFIVARDCPIIVEREVTGHVYGYGFEQLFETRERAEWYCKTTAERTERFEPPMWEEIDDDYEFNFYSNYRLVHFLVSKKTNTLFTKGFVFVRSDEILIDESATKENYIKACEIVRDLFNKGGAK